jgi:hypothetical protein
MSKPSGIEILVTMVEPTDINETLYGALPPVTVNPQGSHVERLAVTLGVIARDVDGAGGRHDVSCPAILMSKLAIRMKSK